MDETLKQLLAQLNERAAAMSPAAPAAEAGAPTATATVEPGTKSAPDAAPTAPAQAAAAVATAPDMEALIAAEIAKAQAPLAQGMKSMADLLERLTAAPAARQMTFDASTVAAGGAPAHLKITADLKSNPSVHNWIVAVGRQALGRSSADEIDSIRYALDQKALAEGNLAVVPNTGADLGTGGALAPVQLNQSIIDYLWPNVIVRKAGAEAMTLTAAEMIMPRILPASGSTMGSDPSMNPFPTSTSENGVIPATTMAFGQRSLRPQELAVIVAVSRQLVVDSDPAVEQVLRDALVRSIATIEDRKFLRGTGTAPDIKGLLNYTTGDGANIVTAAAAGREIVYNDLVNAITTLQGQAVPMNKACWMMHPLLLGALRKLTDGQGRPLLLDYINIQQGTLNVTKVSMVPTLFGLPIFLTQQMPVNQAGTSGNTYTNATSLVLVDMDYVKIGQRGTLELTTSTDASYVDVGGGGEQSAFIRNQILFRAIERVDITMTVPNALYMLQGLTGF